MPQDPTNQLAGSASPNRREKFVLVLLLGLTAIILVSVIAIFYVVPYYGFGRIYAQLPWIMAILMGGLAGVIVLALSMLILVIVLGHDVPFSRTLRSLAVKYMLPVLIGVGKLLGFRREDVQHAFVAVNNELVLAQCRNGHPPRRILLLMPHCLQDRDCKVKITYDVQNCKRCGKCSIKGLIELAERYQVDISVATGGTIARRIVIETRPHLIIAVACERDLTSGIQDTTPLPVYGVFNQRPFGPCLNTRVPLERVEAVLREIASLRREDS